MFKITAVSSQSEIHPVSNITDRQTYRFWKTDEHPSDQATIELEFYKPTKVTNLEIGNAGSAFIEILAGDKNQKREDFQAILPVTQLMTLQECKSNSQSNRVKVLDDKINKATSQKTYEILRITVRQPYNQSPFGLSFLNINNSLPLNSELEKKASDEETPQEKKIDVGKLLRRESTASKDSGYLFKTKSEIKDSPPAKTTPVAKTTTPILPFLSTTNLPKKDSLSQSKTSTPVVANNNNSNNKPFDRLMSNVLFVLSGFQGEERNSLRDKATKMGAQYDANWSKKCTHLICNYANTPKYKEVKQSGNGEIVKSQWIIDCFNQKKLIDIDNYLLDGPSSIKRKNDEENNDDDDVVMVTKKAKTKSSDEEVKASKKGSDTDPMADVDVKQSVPKTPPKKVPAKNKSGSGSDTDPMANEEIKKSVQKTPPKKVPAKKSSGSGSDTDPMADEEIRKSTLKTPPKKVPAKKTTGSGSDTDPMADEKIKKSTQKTPTKKVAAKILEKNDSDTDPMADVEIKKSIQKTPPKKVPAKNKSGSGSDTDPMADEEIKKAVQKTPTKKVPAKKSAENGSDTDPMADEEIKKASQKTPPKKVPAKKSVGSGSDTDPMAEDEIKKSSTKKVPAKKDSDTDPMEEEVKNFPKSKALSQWEVKMVRNSENSLPEEDEKEPQSKNSSASNKKQKNYLLDVLPNFFSPFTIFLYGDFPPNERKELQRYIVAYGGKLVEYLTDEVTHVVTNKKWDEQFDEALESNENLRILKPSWILKCKEANKLVPWQKHIVSPQ